MRREKHDALAPFLCLQKHFGIRDLAHELCDLFLRPQPDPRELEQRLAGFLDHGSLQRRIGVARKGEVALEAAALTAREHECDSREQRAELMHRGEWQRGDEAAKQ